MTAQGQDAFTIRTLTADQLALCEGMWHELYRHQQEHGQLTPVPADGFARWGDSLRAALGRFACVWLAEQGSEPVGFVTGRLRSLPPYFGGQPVGFLSEVYVREGFRKLGAGRRLLEAATEWFQRQGVRRLELQVLSGNPEAQAMYRHLGWREELVQMVWLGPEG